MDIQEGYMPFKGYKTYYRIVGQMKEGATPLLLIHGGPGSTHDYFETLDRIADTGRPVISYDQIGCGKSFVEGHPEWWRLSTWMEELKALRDWLHLDEIHLLGQSWGGMLVLAYLIEEKPAGVRSAILASTLPSSVLYGREQHRLIRLMSDADQEAIARAETTGNYSDAAYLQANAHFMRLHCSEPLTDESPECLRRPKRIGTEAYVTAWGPNEYTPQGTLKDFDYIGRLNEIEPPCLITSGTDDMCTPFIAKTMYDRIPDSQWELFEGCRHMSFVEQNDRYCQLLEQWLEDKDNVL